MSERPLSCVLLAEGVRSVAMEPGAETVRGARSAYWTKGQLTARDRRCKIPSENMKGVLNMNSTKRFLVMAATLGLAAGLIACSTLTVSTDYDPAANFAQFKTFTVMPLEQFQNNQITADRIKAAITQALQARGLQPAAEGADLQVQVFAKLSKETQITSTGTGGYGGWGYRGWGYGGGMSTTTVQDVAVGTLVVDLVDAKTDKPVWRGTASDTLEPKSTGEQKQEKLNYAMNQMFAKYPPGGGK
jgi:hypothetical protein